jgi:hydroxyacyl-ACP dehydratase HTD2-like protein with hotdog domain
MAVAQLDIEQLKQHIGRRLTATDIATAAPANLLRHTFGRSEPEFETGDPVPPGRHLLYFLPRFGPSELRPDGSPLDSGVVPPMPLPTLLIDFARDMSAGRTLLTYTTQARAPLFDTAPFELRGRPSTDDRSCELWAVTPGGTVAMSAQAEFQGD